jgi:hypothetical protein
MHVCGFQSSRSLHSLHSLHTSPHKYPSRLFLVTAQDHKTHTSLLLYTLNPNVSKPTSCVLNGKLIALQLYRLDHHKSHQPDDTLCATTRKFTSFRVGTRVIVLFNTAISLGMTLSINVSALGTSSAHGYSTRRNATPAQIKNSSPTKRPEETGNRTPSARRTIGNSFIGTEKLTTFYTIRLRGISYWTRRSQS